jgi:hypothetical protein
VKIRIQVALLLGAILYASWGLGLLLASEASHALISRSAFDGVTANMFGASLLALVVIFLVAAREPVGVLVRASAVSMLIIGAMAAALMFLVKIMPVNPTNIISIVVDFGVCGFLLFAEIWRPASSGSAENP